MGPENESARLGGDLTPGERLARRGYGDTEFAAGLPSSGSSQDRIFTEPDRDYADDVSLCFERGNQVTQVRVTPADRPKLFAAAGGLAPELAELRRRARSAGLSGARHGTDLAGKIEALTVTAHAAGYRLAVEDQRETAQSAGYVADYLAGRLEQARRNMGEPRADDAHAEMFRSIDALRRVIALLEGK